LYWISEKTITGQRIYKSINGNDETLYKHTLTGRRNSNGTAGKEENKLKMNRAILEDFKRKNKT
jgi:hypothetical protein